MDSKNPAAPAATSHAGARPPLGPVEFIMLVASLMAMNALAIDIMLPALPMIGDALNVEHENSRQHVLTAYVLGFGGAQLLFGPLSDRYGRKAPLLVGLALYFLAAFAGAFAPDYSVMLAARFLQGVGAAATRVLAISIVRDTHGGRKMAEVMSLVMMVLMIAPVLAPAVGQLIVLFADWPMIYLFMAAGGLTILIWTQLRLPETLPADNRTPFTPTGILSAFLVVVTNRIALFYALTSMAVFGSIFGFISSAQQIFVGIYGLGALFPLMFALIGGIMALSSLLNSRIVGRVGMRRLSHAAVVAYFLVSLVWMLASLVFGILPLAVFIVLFSSCNFFFGWINANVNAIAMEPLAKVAGTGSAVFGFLQTVGGGLIGAIIGQSFDGTATPIAVGYFIVSSAALLFILIAERGRLFQVVNTRV